MTNWELPLYKILTDDEDIFQMHTIRLQDKKNKKQTVSASNKKRYFVQSIFQSNSLDVIL